MKASSEADLVVSLAVRAADAAYRGGPAATERTVTAGAKLTGEEAGSWAAARVAERRGATGGATPDGEVARHDAAAAVVLASALAEADPGGGFAAADLMPAPTGVLAVGPGAIRSMTDVVGAVLAPLAAGGAVIIVTPPDAPLTTRATVEALAAAAVDAGGPAGVVQCVGPDVGRLVVADPRVALVVPGLPPGAVPVVAGPDTDPVALAHLLVADGGDRRQPGPFAPTVLITTPEVIVALVAPGSSALCLLDDGHLVDDGEVAALRRYREAEPPAAGAAGAAEVARAAGISAGTDVRLLLAPVAALVPEDVLASPWPPAVAVVVVDDVVRAGRAVRAAVRVGEGPGPVLAVHGEAWRRDMVATGAAAGFGRIAVDGPTTPTDPIAAAPLRPADALRWTRVTGWAGPWPAPGGPPGSQPPYPHPSNREPG
jgi:hypothetical protein